MNEEYCKNCPLIEEIAKLRAEIEELKKPAKHSGNSSLPLSSDQNRKPYPKRDKTGRKPGGQPGHKGHNKVMYDNPDEIVELYLEKKRALLKAQSGLSN